MKNPTRLNGVAGWIAAALIGFAAAPAHAQDAGVAQGAEAPGAHAHPGTAPAAKKTTNRVPNPMPPMDHGAMERGSLPETDHGGTPDSPASSPDARPIPYGDSGSAGGAMDMSQAQGGSAPPNARDPNGYSDGYGFGPLGRPPTGDERAFGSLLVDRLERGRSAYGASTVYDLEAWYGRDYDRAVLKVEGEASAGKLRNARTELLWGHAIAAFWDTQLGPRYDSGIGPDRRWLAFGVQGLAPYWFDVEATAYLGEDARSALRLAARYELLLTQRLILQPRVEATAYGKSDPQRELGSGMSGLTAGLRLRYEVKREFAPYVGLERRAKFGGTADFTHAAGDPTRETRLLAGVRFWF